MIQIQCSCGQVMQARDEHAGKAISCTRCQQRVQVPSPDDYVQPETPAPSRRHPDDDYERPRRRRPPRRSYDDDDYDRPPPRTRSETSGKALVGFILGLGTFVVPVILAIPAVLFSILGLKDVKNGGGRITGSGLAKAGLILGILGNVTLVGYIWGFRVVKTQVERQDAKRESNLNLRQIALAFHNFHDVTKTFPPAVVYDNDGRPLYSWRVLILPYIEQDNIYRRFNLKEPWDSPHNKQFLSQMPSTYRVRAKQDDDAQETFYQVFTGDRTLFGPSQPFAPFHFAGPIPLKSSRRTRFADVTDGTSNTMLVAEAAKAVPWTAPQEIAFNPGAPFAGVGGVVGDGFNVAMADGSVRFISFDRIGDQTMRNAVDPNDGMALGADW